MATGGEPRWPREIELKLVLPPRDHATVLAHPAVRRRLAERPRRRTLRTRYYDTADRVLRANGAALRVRQDGGRFEQTLKLADADGNALAERVEWSGPVEDLHPRPERIPRELAARAGLRPDAVLEPLFETRFRRWSALLRWRTVPGGTVELELALDHGWILAGDRRERISELELEVRRGPARAAFALAEELRAKVALRPSVADKAIRGHLLSGAPPPLRRPSRARLERTTATGAAFGRLLRGVLAHWLASDLAARHHEDPEAVHQLRVALRRGLVLFALFRPVLPPRPREAFRARLKEVLGGFAALRELDVIRDEILAPLPEPDAASTLLRERLERGRAEARRAVTARLASPAYAALLLDLAGWVEREGWRDEADPVLLLRQELPLAEHASRMLTKSRKRLLRAARDPHRLDVEARHELRLAAKRMRYAIDFFAPLHPTRRTAPWLRRLRRLQNMLGEDSDLAAARRAFSRLLAEAPKREREALAAAAGFALGWHTRRLADLPERLDRELTKLRDLPRFW